MQHNSTRGTARICVLAALSVGILSQAAAVGATKYWEPADGIGSWNYGPYWNPSGVPIAGDNVRIEAGGSGWTLICNYINATNPLLNRIYIGNYNTTGTADARLLQGAGNLHADREYVGYYGRGEHRQSGGSVTIDSTQYIGYTTDGDGYYELSGGTLDSEDVYVGYSGAGEFLQTNGTHTVEEYLRVANTNSSGTGTYTLENGGLITEYTNIGGNGLGTFEQSGGTHTATIGGVVLGVCEGDGGTYTLSGGDMHTRFTRLAWSGSQFTQSGGTHTIDLDLELGYAPDPGHTAVYQLSGTGALTVDDDMVISDSGPAQYTQTGGNADITGTIWVNPDGELSLEGGMLTAGNVVNENNFEQSGGEFVGDLTNNGTFTYTGGTFDQGTLTNNGTFTRSGSFTCKRLVQNAYSFTVTPSTPVTADGAGYASAFESNGNLTIQDGATLTVINAPLVSNGPMYAPGAVHGDVESNDYLLPATGADTDEFYIDGDFTQSGSSMLRVRLGGTMPITDFDRVRLTGHATLGGTLQVLLVDGFTPSLGDVFRVMICSGVPTGQFDTLSLPALPNDWEWDVRYLAGLVQLDVVEPQLVYYGDMDCDDDVDMDDVPLFIEALVDPDNFTGCDINRGDMNEDESVNGLDTQGFVHVLVGP